MLNYSKTKWLWFLAIGFVGLFLLPILVFKTLVISFIIIPLIFVAIFVWAFVKTMVNAAHGS